MGASRHEKRLITGLGAIAMLAAGVVPAYAANSSTQYVITVQLQPQTGDASSSQNQAFVALTKQYEKAHPNVTVQFLPNSYTDISTSNAALLTKASAKAAPDIIWQQYGPANSGSIPNGILLNLARKSVV